MSVVGSDFHGNKKKLDKFLNYKPDKEHVFAGDAVDSYYESHESQLKVLKTLVEDTDCILIYGNHELSYKTGYRISCSGRHQFGMENFPPLLESPKWRASYVVDNYLITHAGVSTRHVDGKRKLSTISFSLEKRFKDLASNMWDVGICRGGYKTAGGPFWYDFRYDIVKLADVNQVFGHCSLQEPWQNVTPKGHKHICVNLHDTQDACWIYDTEEERVIIL